MSELLRPDRPDSVPAYVPDALYGAGRPKPGVPVEVSYLTNHLRLRLPFGGGRIWSRTLELQAPLVRLRLVLVVRWRS